MVGLALTLLSIPFLLPIISWVMTYRLRTRVAELEERLSEQRDQISTLSGQVVQLRKQVLAALFNGLDQPCEVSRGAARWARRPSGRRR